MAIKQTANSLKAKTIKKNNGCWEFCGAINRTGYGVVGCMGKVMNAQRAMWILKFGEIASSKIMVCHKCDNRKCINPDHLFLGYAIDNTKDMLIKNRNFNLKKVKCKRGHLFTPENTIKIIRKNGRSQRDCRLCRKLYR